MTDFRTVLEELRRPRLLIRAARHGLSEYRRERDLRRLIGAGAAPSPDRALPALIAAEARLEDTRLRGDAAYSIARHIEVLIALLGEARLIPRDAL